MRIHMCVEGDEVRSVREHYEGLCAQSGGAHQRPLDHQCAAFYVGRVSVREIYVCSEGDEVRCV